MNNIRNLRYITFFVSLLVFSYMVSPPVANAGINDISRWLAATNLGLKYSDDEGSTWNDTDAPYTNANVVAQNGTIWLAGTTTGGDLMYSEDGITWTGLGYHTAGAGTRYITGLAWNGSRWVAVGYPGGTLYSDDGVTWSSRNPILGTTVAVASNGSRFIVVGSNIAFSDNGADWTIADNNPFDVNGTGIASNGSRWVAVGRGSVNDIAYSDDNGVTWVGALNLGCFNCSVRAIAWDGSKFVAVTNDDFHSIYYSADGITWTGEGDVFGGNGYGYAIAWNGTRFIAGGQYGTTGTLMTSTNGTAWTSLGTTFSSITALASAPAPALFPPQEGDSTAPSVSSLSPTDNATSVSLTSNLVITFDEAVDAETGNIVIYENDGELFETIDVTSDQVTGSGTDTVTINPSKDFEYGKGYYVLIDATAFDDASSNSYAGIADATTWSFNALEDSGSRSSSGSRSTSRNTVVVAPAPSSSGDTGASASVCKAGDKFSITTGEPCPTPDTQSSSDSPVCTITIILKVGSRGDEVKCLQSKLNILSDGIFGPLTKSAVVEFQKAKGLLEDGIVGSITRSALFSQAQ
jgi:hypothetical protein